MCGTRCVLAFIALCVGVVQSWDFATTKGDLLEFYDNRTITESVRFDSQNLTALIYDEVHNMMLYVNKQSDNDVICGYYISALEKKCFTEGSGRNIHGLAFDPVTEKLFFSDTKERSINWITLKTGSDKNVYGNLLLKMSDGIPTDLAVDSCRGYVYWINTNLEAPTIERAHFDGSKREVLITTVPIYYDNYKLEPHGLAIDQQLQRIYWMEPTSTEVIQILYADLNGENQKQLPSIGNPEHYFPQYVRLYSLSVSKTDLYIITRRLNYQSNTTIFKRAKSISDTNHKTVKFSSGSDVAVGIATNYKLEDKLPEILYCEPLRRLIRNKSDGPFCVHGTKVYGHSFCKCTPGYIGERCDVSVCNNYCMHGDCNLNNKGLPECRCNAGYSGDRCEMHTCSGYCQNNGDCSLNENSEPVCVCKEDYVGDRCEVSDCLNYCIQGNCSINDKGFPECRCNAGYSGTRCEVNNCYGYCLNNGVCSLDEDEDPFCQCADYDAGPRCELVQNDARSSTDTSKYYPAVTNLTLADLLSKWRKPKMFVIVDE